MNDAEHTHSMTGTIIKGIAGFYYVAVAGSGIYECKAKGLFRREGIKPLVGDRVRLKLLSEADREANIEEILPRRNALVRPAVANVDQAVCLLALADPEPNFGVLDRMLIQMERQNLPVLICLNKEDLTDERRSEEACSAYAAAGYPVILCSARKGTGVEEMKRRLAGKTSVIAGPSGVGKSSMVNLLSPDTQMETGAISEKLKRGRHTTRHSQLIVLDEGTYICDTPGFTSFVPEQMAKEELRDCFPEFRPHEGTCRFGGCVHVNEPGCSVKDAVAEGTISKIRYRSYVQLFQELQEQEKKKYK